jgi:hypothetical protein
MNERHCICGQRAESLVMLVNEFVLSTDLAVQNHRANYSVRKLTAATIITLIFQPAILVSVFYGPLCSELSRRNFCVLPHLTKVLVQNIPKPTKKCELFLSRPRPVDPVSVCLMAHPESTALFRLTVALMLFVAVPITMMFFHALFFAFSFTNDRYLESASH